MHVDYRLYVSFCRYLIRCAIFIPKNKVHFTLKTTHTSTQDAVNCGVLPSPSPHPPQAHPITHTCTHRPLSVLIFSSKLVTSRKTPPPAELHAHFWLHIFPKPPSYLRHNAVHYYTVKPLIISTGACVQTGITSNITVFYSSWIQSPCSHLFRNLDIFAILLAADGENIHLSEKVVSRILFPSL